MIRKFQERRQAHLAHADLALADLYAETADVLRGVGHDPTSVLFISLADRWATRAVELREKYGWISPDAYSSDPQVRAVSAWGAYASTAQLALLAQDQNGTVAFTAREVIASRAE